MKIGFKSTIWGELEIPHDVSDDTRDEIIEKLNKGELKSADDVIRFLEDKGHDYWEFEHDPNTDVEMKPEDNGGDATVEVQDEDRKVLWDNVDGKDSKQ